MIAAELAGPWERVTAGELAVGDRFASTRTDAPVLRVVAIEENPTTRWITYVWADGSSPYDLRIRPRRTTKFWRAGEEAAS